MGRDINIVMDNIYANRVEMLREMMLLRGWDAIIITGQDPHISEYPASRWRQIEWLSGFTGEAGDIVITADHAGLWTDTRYFIQAIRQLKGTGIELHKTRVPDQVLIPEWLSERFGAKEEVVVAVDDLCQQTYSVGQLKDAFRSAGRDEGPDSGYCFHICDIPDMLDMIWNDRPAVPQTPIVEVSASITGESRTERIRRLREAIAGELCDAMLVTALDEIAWLLNIRGSDIEYNPMTISYLLVTETRVRWFVRKDGDGDSIPPETLGTFASLSRDGIEILPYDDLQMTIDDCLMSDEIHSMLLDPQSTNWSIFKQAESSGKTISGKSPVQLFKAVKNAVEIEGLKQAHILDGIAMERFLYWLEKKLNGDKIINEWIAAATLRSFRAASADYLDDSFETISAYGPGAALPHYITPRKDAPELEAHGLYLCDSGAQYTFGTTDITRTIPLGPCTALEREDYTLVLKGHIALAMAIFPEGTAGCQIDALARNPLWQRKRNFGHGTGHGVGFRLGVHEGPQDIRQNFNRQPLLPGMVTSDEPGIYREGLFGVRHENLLLTVEAGRNDFGRWMQFETLTLCHFDTSIVLKELLSREETAWLNAYNKRVFETLAPHLTTEVAGWLKEKTRAI